MKTLLMPLLLFLSANTTLSQIQNIQFGNVSTEHGLSLNDVKNIFQDSKGFIWFGTRDGLNKYDGNRFIIYRNNPLDTTSISSNDIKYICEDSKGYLWIATTGGLNRFDRAKETFTRFLADPENKNSPSSDQLYFIFIDKDDNLFIGPRRGVTTFDPITNKFSNYHFLNDRSQEILFTSFFLDSKRNLWMGSASEGLKCFDTQTKEFTHFLTDTISKSMLNHPIRALYEDHQGYIWIGTLGNGLYRYDPGNKTFLHYKHKANDPNSLCMDEVGSLGEDNLGNLWIGTQYGGLSILDKARKQFVNFQKDEFDPRSLADNTIQFIRKDGKGTMWLATYSGGVNFYDKSLIKFRQYKYSPTQNSLSHNMVKGLIQDKSGIIWIATEGGGLNAFNPATDHFKSYRHNDRDKNSLSSDAIINMCMDNQGQIWISTMRDGLNLFNPQKGTFKTFKHNKRDPGSIRNNTIYGMAIDSDGQFWVSVTGGLQLFSPAGQNFTFFPHPSAEEIDFSPWQFYNIFADSKGIIWLKSDFGLHQFDRKTQRFTYLKQDPASPTNLSNNAISCFLEDSQGNLWIGTENGLNLLNRSNLTFTRYGLKDGLPNTFITGLLEDDRGTLWFTHSKGLSSFNPKTQAIRNYDVRDGIQSNEFRRSSCLKTQNGEMYFGGIKGFNVFHPDSLTDNNFVPPVYLVDFQLFNKSVPIGSKGSPFLNHISVTKELTLSYKQSVFSFEYAALNYIHPQKNQYAYKLEGFDNDWNYVGNKRTATYTNLDAGEYTFSVMASNNDGLWNEEGTSIQLIITPPFWLTWWFKVISILFLFTCLITFYRIRIGMIKRQKNELEDLVKKRTEEISLQKDEIIEKNNEIMTQNEQLLEQQEELGNQRNVLALHNKTIEEKNTLLENQQLHLEKLVEKRTHELTKTNKELVDKNKRLEQYGFVTSHNFRGPVATLLGLCEIYNKADLSDPLNLTILDKTRETALKIDGMIRDLTILLDQDKDLEALFQPIHLETVVKNIKILLDSEIKETESKILYSFVRAPIIHGVPAYVNSIFYNLINNAIKFRRDEISPIISITSEQNHGLIYLSFKDNGMGIDLEKYKNEIFHPFKRLNPDIPGKGLGLHLVKTQMEAMHGTIETFSKKGEGTSFTLTFPKKV